MPLIHVSACLVYQFTFFNEAGAGIFRDSISRISFSMATIRSSQGDTQAGAERLERRELPRGWRKESFLSRVAASATAVEHSPAPARPCSAETSLFLVILAPANPFLPEVLVLATECSYSDGALLSPETQVSAMCVPPSSPEPLFSCASPHPWLMAVPYRYTIQGHLEPLPPGDPLPDSWQQ